jgi:hypothetical protein
MKELPAPPDAADAQAVELLRVWVVAQNLACSLDVGACADADTWGAVLADVARNVAEALQAEGKDAADTLRRIRAVFEEELASSQGAGG